MFQKRRSVVRVATRSGSADLEHLRSQAPLHDTADELCAVARDLKLIPDDIVLGARATEAAIKKMSGEGRLALYLSASEVATLKLDADWVILSACNTAARGSDKAEALSGLARAFFYAGARALLVSHWAVDSAATVKFITQAVGATVRDKKLGRAEALRRSMPAMIDRSEWGQKPT